MGASPSSQKPDNVQEAGNSAVASKSNEEWEKQLTSEQFYVTRQKGTERAFTGDEKYLKFQTDGNLYYKCAACLGECCQVTGPDDAVHEFWRRRDNADHDQIASLRVSAGLPPVEEFSISIYSDGKDYSPIKNGHGSIKTLVKESTHIGTKNTLEYSKKLPKKSEKKKGNHASSIGTTAAHQNYGLHLYDRLSTEFTLTDEKSGAEQLNRTEGVDMLSSTREKCSINEAGIMKHDFAEEVVAYNRDRPPKVKQVKSSKSEGSVFGFSFGNHASKLENVKGKKLVIHLGARNRNVKQDVAASNGSENVSQQNFSKHTVKRNNGEARIYECTGLKFQSGKGNITDGPTSMGKTPVLVGKCQVGGSVASEHGTRNPVSRTEEVPLERHSKETLVVRSELQNNIQKLPALDSLSKDPKPLLKLKFKNPYHDKLSSLVPPQEKKSFIKGKRSKRRKNEKKHVSEEGDREGINQAYQEIPVTKIMDANWILKKLGNDAIGKRVEVQQPSDSSWHRGEVADTVENTSTIIVRLDAGQTRNVDLGKQTIRFVSQKQKRTRS